MTFQKFESFYRINIGSGKRSKLWSCSYFKIFAKIEILVIWPARELLEFEELKDKNRKNIRLEMNIINQYFFSYKVRSLRTGTTGRSWTSEQALIVCRKM